MINEGENELFLSEENISHFVSTIYQAIEVIYRVSSFRSIANELPLQSTLYLKKENTSIRVFFFT
ncbi:hypothetical protein IGL76_000381 [Enterococcus sp. DIV2381]